MKTRFLCCIFIVFFLTIHTGLQASYCSEENYITIDDARRSTAYNSTSKDQWLCDRSIIQDNAWYRFNSGEAGGEMPTSKPKLERCGTYSPIWMKGSHPTVEEGTVKRSACVVIPYVADCAKSYSISVRNCSGYYIYQLKTPLNCYNAYCAGSKLPNCTNVDPKDYCLENRPPFIRMPDRLYTFENSKFQLVVNATDPEGYPIRDYDYVPNAVSSISNDRELVTISVKTSTSITFTVTDYGRLQAIHTIVFVAKNCNCQNGGTCYTNDKTNVSTKLQDLGDACDCVKPYTGKFCEISPCDKLPCFSGLRCSVEADNYRCEKCPVQFQGDGKYCQLIPTEETSVIEAQLAIISGLNWNNDLSIKTSHFYKQQTAEIVAQIIQTYNSTKDFLFVVVIGYRKGSVVVDFRIVFKKKMDDPLEPLRTRVQRNKDLGRFQVDLHSIKEDSTFFVNGELKVVSGIEWKNELLNKSSSSYISVSRQVTSEIAKIYDGEKDFLYVYVTGFRKNLIVDFTLVWLKKVSNPLEKLKNKTRNGKLGPLEIDTKSVKKKPPTVNSKEKSYFGLNKVVFIVVVTLVSILALVSIVVCGICIKRKPISIIMLTRNDDHQEICPSNSNNDSCFNMKKIPSRNQVVNLENVANDKNSAWS